MLVRPTQAFIARHDGVDLVLGPSDILDDAHPVVRNHPDLFERVRPTVEQATANPGEQRNVRRG